MAQISFTAVDSGPGGNSITVAWVVSGDNTAFSVGVVGDAITINVATDAGGNPTQNVSAIVPLINASAAGALVTAAVVVDGILTGLSIAPTNLAGGSGAGGANVDQLVDLGVIVRDYVQKPYMNDYIPVALLFPFLNAQAPGFLYPEIYIPRNQQMLFDLNYLYPNFTPTSSPVTITLGLKGMKVYAQ